MQLVCGHVSLVWIRCYFCSFHWIAHIFVVWGHASTAPTCSSLWDAEGALHIYLELLNSMVKHFVAQRWEVFPSALHLSTLSHSGCLCECLSDCKILTLQWKFACRCDCQELPQVSHFTSRTHFPFTHIPCFYLPVTHKQALHRRNVWGKHIFGDVNWEHHITIMFLTFSVELPWFWEFYLVVKPKTDCLHQWVPDPGFLWQVQLKRDFYDSYFSGLVSFLYSSMHQASLKVILIYQWEDLTL